MKASDSFRLALVAAFVGTFAFVAGIIVGSGAIDAMKEWQTLIGALVASAAVGVAYINVSRQVRMNVILREEKIINDELPGVIDAVHYLSFLNFKLSDEPTVAQASEVLESYGVRADTYTVRAQLDKQLPQTRSDVRSSIAQALAGVNFVIGVHAAYSHPDDDESEEDRAEGIVSATAELEKAKEYLQQYEKFLSTQMHEWQARFPKLREAIDRYLDR